MPLLDRSACEQPDSGKPGRPVPVDNEENHSHVCIPDEAGVASTFYNEASLITVTMGLSFIDNVAET